MDASSGDKAYWRGNIVNTFKAFGHTPTEQEILALLPASMGEGGEQAGQSAVANYVIAHQALNGAQSLVQGQLKGNQAQQAEYEKLGKQYGAEGVSNLSAAADVFKSAPQLFGGLSEGQVSQYLAPLQGKFDYGLGKVTGEAARRGLSGSSIEGEAMAQAQTQYQQQVLQQALALGIQQQQQRSEALRALGSGQLGLSGQFTGAGGQYGSLINQLLGQNTGLAEDLAQLPGQSANMAIAQNAAIRTLNPDTPSPWGSILGTLLGAGAGAMIPGAGLMGASLGAGLGGQIGSAATGNPAGAQIGGNLQNYGLLYSLLGRSGGFGGGSLFGGGGTRSGNTGLAFPQGERGGDINSIYMDNQPSMYPNYGLLGVNG